MSIGEIDSSGDRWLVGPAVKEANGSSMGPLERLLLLVSVVSILIWGFTGWEYPETEISGKQVRNGGTLMAGDLNGAGEELFQANGCYACHSLTGETLIGPTLLGVFGTTVELDDGSSVLIDDAYLVESILQPDAKRVAGYGEAAMPSYEGIVSAADAEALADYIKSVR